MTLNQEHADCSTEIHQPGVDNTNNDADYGFKDQPVKSQIILPE